MTGRDPYDVVLSRLERKKGNSTFREYKRHLRDFREWVADEYEMTVFDVDSLQIEDMVDDMWGDGDRYSVSSINVRYAALGEFYKQAERLARNGKIEPDGRRPTTHRLERNQR